MAKRPSSLAQAEKKLGGPLPDEYAAFVRGGGPAEGGTLLTLEKALGYETLRVDLPFPFTKKDVTRILRARAGGEPKDTIGSVLPIADAGCNDVTYLVLAGPLRGSVWSSGDSGWMPHARADGTLLGFAEWYETIADEPPKPKTKPKKQKKPDLVIDRGAYQLNLRDRGLAQVPPEVAEMTKVAMVYLGGNALTELPPSLLGYAERLVALELGPNPIGRIEDDAIAKFSKVNTLDLKGTKLERLPDALDRVPVRQLQLDLNPQLDLEQALKVLARMPTLRWLGLSGCALTEVPRGALALKQLERLYLDANAIAVLPNDLGDLKLELLGLTNNQIETIPDALEKQVQNIYFAGNPGSRAEKKRLDALRKNLVLLG